jgi:hypothetical protein
LPAVGNLEASVTLRLVADDVIVLNKDVLARFLNLSVGMNQRTPLKEFHRTRYSTAR